MAGNWSGEVPRGQKRRAETDVEGDQRLTKRLDALQIGPYYSLRPCDACLTYSTGMRSHKNAHPAHAIVAPSRPAAYEPASDGDHMYVDETKDKIYIHDLASEIAEIEANEPQSFFLPEFDKKITAIPPSVLGGGTVASADNQMVLYQVPTSLTVPEDQDSVRKAILETRARAREKHRQVAALERATATVPSKPTFEPSLSNGAFDNEPYDPDAMDIG